MNRESFEKITWMLCTSQPQQKELEQKSFLSARAASPLLFVCVNEKQIIITVGEAISLFMARQMQDDVIHYFVK